MFLFINRLTTREKTTHIRQLPVPERNAGW
jgi:hypothetical protein